MKRIIGKAGEFSENIDWKKVRQAVRDHKGYPVAVLNKKRSTNKRSKDELEEFLEEADGSVKEVAPVVAKAPDSHIYDDVSSDNKVSEKAKRKKITFND